MTNEMISSSAETLAIEKENGRELFSPICLKLPTMALLAGVDDCEDYEQCKQNQRFDKRQSQNHHSLDTSGCTWIAGRALTSCRTDARLTNRTTKRRNRETDTGGDGAILTYRTGVITGFGLSEYGHCTHENTNHSEQQHSELVHLVLLFSTSRKISFS